MKYNIVMFAIAFIVIAAAVGSNTGVHIVNGADTDSLNEGSEWAFLSGLAEFDSNYPIIKTFLLILGLGILAVIALSVLE